MGELKEIRDLFAHDEAEWKPIKDEGMTDVRYAAGDPWAQADRDAREKAKRPCLSVDETGQYINQTVNEIRANKRAVKFTPVGNGADDASAKFYADKMREIEYRSRAQIAYTTAFENCVIRSFGFVRVNTTYESPRAVNQDIRIAAIANPNLVIPDAEWQMPDLSDMRHCWVREPWSLEEHDRQYPKNKLGKFAADLAKTASGWFTGKGGVFVGEYWKITSKTKKLLIAAVPGQRDPIGVFEEDFHTLPEGAVILSTREVEDARVVQQITNGHDILDETEWPGKFIPIIGCLGKVMYVAETGSDKRRILSMIRLARDPQMMLAYLATAEAETVGSLTKFPYFAMRGSLSPAALQSIAASLHEPVAVVEVEPFIEGLPQGREVPFPQRNPWTLDLSSLEMAKESFRRAIQAAMGQSPLPTSAQRRNEKSGVALKHIEESGQKGSFHFTDHYLDMLTQVGIVCEDLIDKIYDTPRDTGIRKDDDAADVIRINDPSDPESVSTKGDHLVTVATGQSFDSERDAANEFAGDLLESPILQMIGPEKAPKIIAKAIKLKNLGLAGDQIAEIIDPEPPKDGQPPSAEQAQQMLAQAQGKIQELEQVAQQMHQVIETKQVEQQAAIEKAKIDADARMKMTDANNASRERIAADTNAVKLTDIQARINAAVAQAMITYEAQHLDQAHQVGMASLAQAHTLEQGDQQHGQALQQGAQAHGQTLEQGDVSHQQNLEAGAQQHAAALEQQAAQPPAGAGA